MANPVVVACALGAWTKVLTSGTLCRVHILSFDPSQYYETYRLTAAAAPTDLTDAVPLVSGVTVTFGANVDMYIWAKGEIGSVRVDT